MNDDEITSVCLTRWPERSHMFRDALRFWHLQAHPHKKLLIINDGKVLRSDDPRVMIVNLLEQKTIGEKRNYGLRTATSPWIACHDDDDGALPLHIATLLAEAKRQNVPWMRSARAWLSDARLRIVDQTADQLHCTTLVRRSVALQAGGYPDVNYAEDASLATRLRMLLGMAPGSGPRCEPITYVHRRHRANISSGHSTAGLDEQARRGLVASQWWTSTDIDQANQRVAKLLAVPVPTMVYPLDGSYGPRQTVILDQHARLPFHVHALIDDRDGRLTNETIDALNDAGCLRAIGVLRSTASLWESVHTSGHEPGAWLIVPSGVRGLRSDHVCRLVEAVRAGGMQLARGLADNGDLVNKVGPWLPAGRNAIRVARRSLIDRVPPSLRSDEWFGMALDEVARRGGMRVESIVLDGVPSADEPLADRALRVWEAAKHIRSVAW